MCLSELSERESDNARVRVTGGGTTDKTKGDGERLEIAQDQYLAGSQGLPEPEESLTTGPEGSPLPVIPRFVGCPFPSPLPSGLSQPLGNEADLGAVYTFSSKPLGVMGEAALRQLFPPPP